MRSDAPLPANDRVAVGGDPLPPSKYGHISFRVVGDEGKPGLVLTKVVSRECIINVHRSNCEEHMQIMANELVNNFDMLSGMGYTDPPEPRAKRKYTRKPKPDPANPPLDPETIAQFQRLPPESKNWLQKTMLFIIEASRTMDEGRTVDCTEYRASVPPEIADIEQHARKRKAQS